MTLEIKPLVIAFACEPALGSEPGVGWHLVHALSRIRPVWVVTHEQHRNGIEAYLAKTNDDRISVSFYTLPRWLNWTLTRSVPLNFYYYCWHIGAARLARKLNAEHHFTIAHHATYVRYWMPTAAGKIGLPFVWGPVGGGESAPRSFNNGIGIRGRAIEFVRSLVRWIFQKDPALKSAARNCDLGIASSEESAVLMRRLGIRDVRVMSAVGYVESDAFERDQTIRRDERTLRFFSIGRLLHWKGFHLGLRAFAKANLPNSEYVIVGDGPDRARLQRLAQKLGIADRVRFPGALPRREALARMQESDVLVHPSLHDSGGFVVLEAMDLEMPVICLDIGGPAVCVDQTNGYKIRPGDFQQAIDDITAAMKELADPDVRHRLGAAGRRRAIEEFSWHRKAEQIDSAYAKILNIPQEAAPQQSSSRESERRLLDAITSPTARSAPRTSRPAVPRDKVATGSDRA